VDTFVSDRWCVLATGRAVVCGMRRDRPMIAPGAPEGVHIAAVPSSGHRARWVVFAGLLTAAFALPGAAPVAAQDPATTVTAYGDAVFHGGPGALNAPVIAMAATADGGGYWLASSDGGVFTYGDAAFHGSLVGDPGVAGGGQIPVTAFAVMPGGGGYWLVGQFGAVYPMGDAATHGGLANTALNAPIVGMAATPDGGGYWLVASDGGVFAFGDAQYFGSEGAAPLNAPIVGMAATPDGGGYWLVASDGGVFAFGDARFYGSEGATPLNIPIVGMAVGHGGDGYWLAAGDGGVFAFGSASFDGSAGAAPPAHPVAAIAATPDGGGYWLATRVTGPTPVPPQPQADVCGTPEIEPASFLLACGDGNAGFDTLQWSSWSRTSASGSGTYVYNTCVPFCAAGTILKVPGTIRLDEPVSTSAGVEYARVTWTYQSPTGSVTFSDRQITDI
jgi:hypothetical protein